MRGYDQNQEPTTLATNLLLDVLDSHLEANDSFLMLDKPSDINYQEKDVDPSGYKTKMIHTSLYKPSNLQDILDKCVYLLLSQCEQLYSLLNQFCNLFDGCLKTFKGHPVHLELIKNPVPVRRCPYTIPTSHFAVFKEELSRLISIGVIEKAQRSEWIAGTFIVPKKDGCIQWITDFSWTQQKPLSLSLPPAQNQLDLPTPLGLPVFHQTRYRHAILYLCLGRAFKESLYFRHAIRALPILLFAHGRQRISRHCDRNDAIHFG